MYDVMILRDEGMGGEALAGPIASAYTCKVRTLSEVTKEDAADVTVVVVYSELRRSTDVDRLSAIFPPSFRITNMIYVAPSIERAGIVQAESIGLGRIYAPHKTVDDVRRGVREILNRELSRRLARFSRSVNKAMEVTDSFHNNVASAMRQSKPLPLGNLRSTSDAIGSAVRSEGLSTWLNAVKMHHSQTCRHVLNVAGLAVAFATHLELDAADTSLLIEASILHDVGKLFIPIAILEKPGRLTDAERSMINLHPGRGAEALVHSGVEDAMLIAAARSHHEYLDGSGYPDGLGGDAITPLVRLITIIDIYSALTEERVYRESLTPRLAIAELARMKTKLDQRLFAEFRKMTLEPAFAATRKGQEPATRAPHASLRAGLHPLDGSTFEDVRRHSSNSAA
jgi:HD-GYP domain-containing protein (c-di-GMP phosphodiesterase class II)